MLKPIITILSLSLTTVPTWSCEITEEDLYNPSRSHAIYRIDYQRVHTLLREDCYALIKKYNVKENYPSEYPKTAQRYLDLLVRLNFFADETVDLSGFSFKEFKYYMDTFNDFSSVCEKFHKEMLKKVKGD